MFPQSNLRSTRARMAARGLRSESTLVGSGHRSGGSRTAENEHPDRMRLRTSNVASGLAWWARPNSKVRGAPSVSIPARATR